MFLVGELRFPQVLVSVTQITFILLLPLSIYARRPNVRQVVATEFKKLF